MLRIVNFNDHVNQNFSKTLIFVKYVDVIDVILLIMGDRTRSLLNHVIYYTFNQILKELTFSERKGKKKSYIWSPIVIN